MRKGSEYQEIQRGGTRSDDSVQNQMPEFMEKGGKGCSHKVSGQYDIAFSITGAIS